jgi:hypothetical protein
VLDVVGGGGQKHAEKPAIPRLPEHPLFERFVMKAWP